MRAQARILVADDDKALCLLLRETLQDAGYEVLVAYDGDQVVRMAQHHPPDLLLIDLMMPLMDGFEVIRQLRNDTRTAHLPMLILTARSDSSEVVIGFDTGADDYIVKPYDIEVLLARIRSQLRRAAKLPVRNPLTGLPGNILLQAELERQIERDISFALLYVDLDNFKAFNDAYGFARGDRAIHMLANVLTEIASRDDFLGHIGGDDFAIIHYGGRAEDLSKRIIADFDARVPELYDLIDLDRGYLRGIDRHGVPRQFGLLSLSISVVSSERRRFSSVDAISKVAAEVKQAAKSISGSSYVLDRRGGGIERPQDRRGKRRPAALLIHPSERLRAAIATSLRHQGYRPLIAANVVRGQDLLAHTPQPGLLIADLADETIWTIWHNLPTPAPLIAIVPDAASAEAALARGAISALIATESLGDTAGQQVLDGAIAALIATESLNDLANRLLPTLTNESVAPSDAGAAAMIEGFDVHHPESEAEEVEDRLTLLANRHAADRRTVELIAKAEASGSKLSMLMLDLDHFKQVNDRFGHMLGNEVLCTTADLLRAAARPVDLVARFGGEEFLMVLPDIALLQAALIAERIRIAFEDYAWHTLHPQLHLTISIGVAEHEGNSATDLLDATQRRIYLAKAAGRNRVIAEG